VFTADDLASFFAGVEVVAPGVTNGPGGPRATALCAAGFKRAATALKPAGSAAGSAAGRTAS